MGMEIERKFLLRDASWRAAVQQGTVMRQGYLGTASVGQGDMGQGAQHRASVRVRITGEQAWINVKEAKAGIARAEFEYAIPPADAATMLETLCGGVVEKTRHLVRVAGALFEIDEFAGANAGLVVAELELPAMDAPYPHPPWLGAEVSELRRYYNTSLVDHPYRDWSPAERAASDAPC